MEQSFSLPSDFSGVVRLFPLPDLVMFPDNAIPLHVFESRYVEMFEDALEGDRLITMATLQPGHSHDYHSRPPITPVVCISTINVHRKTDEGTYHFMLVGLQRARIEGEVEPVRSFRRARVQLIDDRLGLSEEDAADLNVHLAEKFGEKIEGGGELAEALKEGDIPLGRVTNILSYVLQLPIQTKLQLLEEPDVVKRAQMLLQVLEEMSSNPRRPRGDDDFSVN